MNNKTINPELLLAGARMVNPDHGRERDHYEHRWHIKDGEVRRRIDYSSFLTFDPIKNGWSGQHDAWALERALKKEGWQFRYQCAQFWAWNDWRRGEGKYLDPIGDDSDTLLLLKCVSAMTGIKLYVEDK